jgi:hypothetical protein
VYTAPPPNSTPPPNSLWQRSKPYRTGARGAIIAAVGLNIVYQLSRQWKAWKVCGCSAFAVLPSWRNSSAPIQHIAVYNLMTAGTQSQHY